MNLYDTKERMIKMIKFKVLVIQRGKAFIAYPNDVKRGVVILGTSKNEVLRGSQLAILDEVKKREELFVPDYKATKESIIEKDNISLEHEDIVSLEQVWIEFTNNSVKLGELQ